MKLVFNKRIPKLIKKNIGAYICIFLLICTGLFMIIDINAGARTVISGVADFQQASNLEDGELITYIPFTEEELNKISDKGVDIEAEFYMDFGWKDTEIRVFKTRESINTEYAVSGRRASAVGEIMLEQNYAEENGISIGDKITLGRKEFTVCGLGCSVDYDIMLKNESDFGADSKTFATAFVTENDFLELEENEDMVNAETYLYAFRLNGVDFRDFNDFVRELNPNINDAEIAAGLSDEALLYFSNDNSRNVLSVKEKDSNPRIGASAAGCQTSDMMCTAAAIALLLVSSIVITMYSLNIIENERKVIGVLYTMGVKKSELIRHYIFLPVIIISLAGITGTILGILCYSNGIRPMDITSGYSLPELKTVYPAAMIGIGIIVPPLISLVVSFIAVNKKLSKPVREIMQINETKFKKLSMGNSSPAKFVSKYRTARIKGELKLYLIVFVGLFFGLFLLMIGYVDYVMEKNMSNDLKNDVKFSYLYNYKFTPQEAPEDSEPIIVNSFTKEAMGLQMNVSIIGISKESRYFNYDMSTDKDSVVLSSSAAQKFDLDKGDEFTIYSPSENKEYTFKIADVVQYSAGLYAFMDKQLMTEKFGMQEDYFNAVLSDHELDVNSNMIYSVTAGEEISGFADKLLEDYRGMHIMMSVFGMLFFAVIMFLLIKFMIGRSVREISILKLFGYKDRELKSIFIDSNFIVILISSMICVPLSKKLMDILMPSFCAEYSVGFDTTFSVSHYLFVFALVFVTYFIVNALLFGSIKKISANEVTKDVE